LRIRYYMLCSRFEALIASQLEPEAFGTYMAVGTKKLATGPLIFFEIDPKFASLTDHFKLDDIEDRCASHPDGSPKRSKYISVYRVMEFLRLPFYGALYLTTADGHVLELKESPYAPGDETPGVNLYQELCPLIPMVVSNLAPARFIRFVTDPVNPVNAPRLFFADLLLDRDEGGSMAAYLPYVDPLHLLECIKEVEGMDESDPKPTKTVSRTATVRGFFRTIRRGFFIGDQTGLKFYRFPGPSELEVRHAEWWRSALAQ
jgi:hypothetical protein